MPLADAGKLVWRGGASSYIFTKDYSRILPLQEDPKEDYQRAADGTMRGYRSNISKTGFELTFRNIGATQKNQMSTIWKANTQLDFYLVQTDATKTATCVWTNGFKFNYSAMGIIYKDLWDGVVNLEET